MYFACVFGNCCFRIGYDIFLFYYDLMLFMRQTVPSNFLTIINSVANFMMGAKLVLAVKTRRLCLKRVLPTDVLIVNLSDYKIK